MPEDEHGRGHGPPKKPAFERFMDSFNGIMEAPARIVRESIVEPFHSKNKSYYYHRRYRRVPTIDECYVDDPLCRYEAQEQFRRDRMVDDEILVILRQRRLECEIYHGTPDASKYCKKLVDDYLTAEANWFTKYGDIGPSGDVLQAYMKQKHRLLWERRHGPVGTGMNDLCLEDIMQLANNISSRVIDLTGSVTSRGSPSPHLIQQIKQDCSLCNGIAVAEETDVEYR